MLANIPAAHLGRQRRGLGNQPSEAPDIERVLAGLRESIEDDDQLTMVAGGIFDGLFTAFASEEAKNG
jgi:hypothetical protein